MVKTTVMGSIWVITTSGVLLEPVARLPGSDQAQPGATG